MCTVHLHYTPNNPRSIQHSQIAQQSFLENGWKCELVAGLTSINPDPITSFLPRGRTHQLLIHNKDVVMTKLAILSNHIRFWKMVRESNEVQIYAEHDVVCIRPKFNLPKFKHILALHIGKYNLQKLSGYYNDVEEYDFNELKGCNSLPSDWPIHNDYPTLYKGGLLMPTAGCYAITPTAASVLLDSIEEHGAEQADMLMNTKLLDIRYNSPPLVHFGGVITKPSCVNKKDRNHEWN